MLNVPITRSKTDSTANIISTAAKILYGKDLLTTSRGIFEDINMHRIKLLFIFIESYSYAGMIQSDICYKISRLS